MEYISHSEKETLEIAQKIAKNAKGGDVFALYGDLGSGKTTFARYFAKALGVERIINSPTFVIMKQYQLPESINNIKNIAHLDCYRLNNTADAEAIGLLELIGKEDTVLIIEWPKKIESLFTKQIKKIKFSYINENSRKIEHEK
jgi:tRNA threonylcarbamoyladenosine biosynthesis protein TsaE